MRGDRNGKGDDEGRQEGEGGSWGGDEREKGVCWGFVAQRGSLRERKGERKDTRGEAKRRRQREGKEGSASRVSERQVKRERQSRREQRLIKERKKLTGRGAGRGREVKRMAK